MGPGRQQAGQRLWLVGPTGGGKSALLERLRGYPARAGADEPVLQDRTAGDSRSAELAAPEVPSGPAAAAGRPALPEQDFAVERPGEGHDLGPDDGRIVYVDRAAHHRPLQAPPAAAEVWLVPEGEQHGGGPFEAAFLHGELRDLGCALTLLPEVFTPTTTPTTPAQRLLQAQYVEKRLRWGVRYLELRDDLLTDAQLRAAAALVPGARRLVSVRRQRAGAAEWAELHAAAEAAALWDWPVELGPPVELALRTPRVASLHVRLPGESLAGAIQRLMAAGAGAELLKLAAPVHDLTELVHGHAWMQRDPGRHQFLPACPQGSGRWSWYRLWRGAGQRLNFVRERAASGNAPSADQPTLYEWLVRHESGPVSAAGGPPFAALLGDPVAHSQTPAEQRRYFAAPPGPGWPVLLIAVTEADLRAGAPLSLLTELGLRAAAVTAPRKHDARRWLQEAGGTFVVSDARDPTAVCNTLGRSARGAWSGTNTDGIGLRAGWQALCTEHPELTTARIALWGGGGTQALLRSAFPQAVAYSARSGTPRPGEPTPNTPPEVVVWAVGRSRQPACAWPSPTWQPRYVFDLNYSDDSPGREYATRCGAQYESGLHFFRAQATAQRRFWDDVLT